MNSLKRNARIAGLFYLSIVILGPISLIYIPNQLFVTGNAAATAQNIASHESLLRWGIFLDLLGTMLFLFTALALYRLLEGVDRSLAGIMVLLVVADVPVSFANTVNYFGALLFARGADYLSAFTQSQREAIVMTFLNLHHSGTLVQEVFWGLWLLPFGMLVYKSGFLPRFIGAWLVLNCFAYLAESATAMLWPQFSAIVGKVGFPFQLGEIAIMLWLLIVGAKSQGAKSQPAPSPAQ